MPSFDVNDHPSSSPIHRLPLEILTQIFLHCHSGRCDDITKAPWLLARICSLWRILALTTPGLWNQIDLCAVDAESARPLTEIYLKRSQNSPLYIRFECDRDWNGWKIDPAVLNLLKSHSHRWLDVDLTLSLESIKGFNDLKGELPLLRRLTLTQADTYTVFRIYQDAFATAPQLVEAKFASIQGVDIPWSRLTRYTGEYWEVGEALDILKGAVNLEQCTLNLTEDFDAGPSHTPYSTCRHPKLRSLSLTYGGNVGPDDLLDRLVLPALESLQIGKAGFVDQAIALIARSSCILKTLTATASDDLIPLLRVTAPLVNLGLKCIRGRISKGLLEALTVVHGEECLVPHLQSCSVTESWMTLLMDLPYFLDMVESRLD